MKKILIMGDSFAADWSVKFKEYDGWPNLLAQKYNITNVAQAGVSEYKIYKQLEKVNLNEYDTVIISHTSPYRVHTREHPIHRYDLLHNNADLIMEDISWHANRIKNVFNKSLKAAKTYFIYHFDIEYYETTYELYKQAINDKLAGKKIIAINNFPNSKPDKKTLDFSNLLKTHGGKINHFNKEGNEIIYNKLIEILK